MLVRLDSTGVEEQIVQHQLEATLAVAKLKQAEAELQSMKLDGELQVKIAERVLQLAKLEKDRVLGEGGEVRGGLRYPGNELATQVQFALS